MSNISGVNSPRNASRPSTPVPPPRAKTAERRSTVRPEDAFTTVLFSDSALSGSIPCTPGQHRLEGLGLENLSWGMKCLQLDVPLNTELKVHSHAIDREPVAPASAKQPSMAAAVAGFFSVFMLSAWVWFATAVGRRDALLNFDAPAELRKRDGVLRIHGLEAALTQPLTVTRPGLAPWLLRAELSGASVDEHGNVTPKGDLRMLSIFSLSLERFRTSMPTVNVEIEKLREGHLVAQKSTGPGVNADAICETLSRLTGQGTFTVVRQLGAPTLRYKVSPPAQLGGAVKDFDLDVTPEGGEITAKVKLNPGGTMRVSATSHATTRLQLRSPQAGQHHLRVETQAQVVMPKPGSEWLRAHTVFVVDRSASMDPKTEKWDPLLSGKARFNRAPTRLQASVDLSMANDVLGEGVAPKGNVRATWRPRNDGSGYYFERAQANLPAPKKLARFNLDAEYDDIVISAKRGPRQRINVKATSRVVNGSTKKA